MAGGDRETVVIEGWQWEVVRGTQIAGQRCYPEAEVRRLGGDPRAVEQRAYVVRVGNRYQSDSSR